MEKNEKIQMLLDMQEHPENYSEQELKTMLKDPEVRELMEATALLKQAMIWERLQVGERSSGMNARKNAVNVDAEWQRFAGQHIADSKPRRGWMKVAAVFLGVLFVSGITFAAKVSDRSDRTAHDGQGIYDDTCRYRQNRHHCTKDYPLRRSHAPEDSHRHGRILPLARGVEKRGC